MNYEIKTIAPITSRPQAIEFQICNAEFDWAATVSHVNKNGKLEFVNFCGDDCLVPHGKLVAISCDNVRTYIAWNGEAYTKVSEATAFEMAAGFLGLWACARPKHRLKDGKVVAA